eukprot:COSAG01_NODE_2406_length_7755_cov_316.703892_9_plen_98_part_00
MASLLAVIAYVMAPMPGILANTMCPADPYSQWPSLGKQWSAFGTAFFTVWIVGALSSRWAVSETAPVLAVLSVTCVPPLNDAGIPTILVHQGSVRDP